MEEIYLEMCMLLHDEDEEGDEWDDLMAVKADLEERMDVVKFYFRKFEGSLCRVDNCMHICSCQNLILHL